MTYKVFFVGLGGTVFGTVLGAWLSYGFQKRLLQQQLDFQKQQVFIRGGMNRSIFGIEESVNFLEIL